MKQVAVNTVRVGQLVKERNTSGLLLMEVLEVTVCDDCTVLEVREPLKQDGMFVTGRWTLRTLYVYGERGNGTVWSPKGN